MRLWRGFWAGLLLSIVGCGQAAEHPGMAGPMPVTEPEPDPADGLGLSTADDADACVGVEAAADPLPVDLFALVDGSSSMADATSTGVSKWYALKAGFHDFLAHAPPDMGLGLSLFPVPGDETASCLEQHYRDEALPISKMSEMKSDVLARLDSVTPRGQTPLGPALGAAFELAVSHATAHPERSVVVVLATDGLPTTCVPSDASSLAKLAQAALHGPGHVRTLVVASHSLSGVEASGFAAIAAAGGTGQALHIEPRGDFASQLSQALGAAAARQVACDLAVPEPPAHQQLDYDAVNVVLENEAGRSTFPRVADAASCNAQGGWYYDVAPEKGAPARLNMCKASCDALSDTGAATLRVELGCRTRTVVH